MSRTKPQPNRPPEAPVIAAELEASRIELAGLQDEYEAAALALSRSEEGAVDRLGEVRERRGRLEQRIVDLAAAHKAAEAADRAEELRVARQRYQGHQNRVAGYLKERDAAAERLAKLVAEVTTAWRDLDAASRAAMSACPPGVPWPDGSFCEAHHRLRLARHELWRLSDGDPPMPQINAHVATPPHVVAFPGGEPLNPIERHPSRCPEMVPQFAKASAWVLAQLEAKAPGNGGDNG